MTPDLTDIFEDWIAARIDRIRVALPGKVVAYNAATQRADVQPEVQDGEYDEDEQRIPTTLPVVTDVPVMFPGSGPYRITFPIALGDTVLLVFSSSSLARWKAAGGGTVDPADDRRHHLADAIAIPGLLAIPGEDNPAPDDAVVVHTEAPLKIGDETATDTVARQSDLEALVTIMGGVSDAAGAIAALKLALEGANWPSCASIVKTK